MRDIDIAITTIARENNYLDTTLQSLGTKNNIKLVVGSPDATYLDFYRGLPPYMVLDCTSEDWLQIMGESVWHRASWNYWRCLNGDLRYDNGILIFEDDIKAAAGWREHLDKTITAIEEHHEQNYVLALYSPYKREAYKQGLLYESYPTRLFYGTQGMYYPEKTRVEFTRFLHAFGVSTYRIPYDMLLREYLMNTGTCLLATSPSLIQHIGAVTTGLGGRFHRAPSFIE